MVANACLGLGTPEEDDAWELDEDACVKEAMDASALREHWRLVLDSFETSAVEDDALLTAAKAGRLPGATANIVCAVEYRICLLYTSPSPRDRQKSRMPSSA